MQQAGQEKSDFFANLFFMRKREIMTAAASFVAGVAILIAYFASGPDAAAYAAAEEAFVKWERSPGDEALYKAMKRAVGKTPALQEKYDAAIAQKLLGLKKIDEALAMANRSLERVRDDAPFHTAFAAATLLIERGAYQEALEKAVSLKEQIGRSFDLAQLTSGRLVGGSVLYVHNLVRIAFLQQELKNRAGEKAAWEELESFLKEGSSVASLVLQSFSERELDLTQYIAERKKLLISDF